MRSGSGLASRIVHPLNGSAAFLLTLKAKIKSTEIHGASFSPEAQWNEDGMEEDFI